MSDSNNDETSQKNSFRFGAREHVASGAASLLEFIEHRLSEESPRPALSSLELVELGSVHINEERCLNPDRRLKPGDKVRIHTSPRRYSKPENLRSRIRQEDSEVFVIEKPGGLPSSPEVDNIKENLLSFLEEDFGQHLYLVTALDTESSGLVVIAKTSSGYEKLKTAFRENRIKRIIAAFVEHAVPIGLHDNGVKVLSCEPRLGATSVVTEGQMSWELKPVGTQIDNAEVLSHYRLEIELSEARPLEMRQTLSKLGSPILGDRTHGSKYETISTETGKKTPAFQVTGFYF